jgi:hypothetical protein
MTAGRRKWREGLIAGALVLASTAVALVLGELALRALGFSQPVFSSPDLVAGSRLRAGAAGWARSEGEAYVTINSQGWRDREHSFEKPAGVYRIAVLGDSYAEAMQVPLEKAFWSLLPGQLGRCGFAPGKQIEVLNFGVSAYGTAQELVTLRSRAWRYAPDLVLLAFFPGNDVRNNSKVLEGDQQRPFFVLRGDKLELDESFRDVPHFRWMLRSSQHFTALRDLRLYELMWKIRASNFRVHNNSPIAAALADGGRVPSLNEPGLDENVLRPPPNGAWRDAWEVTDRLIVEMQHEVHAGGARFLLTVLSTPSAVYPDAALRKRYADVLGIDDLFYPETRLMRLARENGIDAVGLGHDMQRYADATGSFLHGFPNSQLGFGHWNQAGHALAASLIARHLCPG